MVENELISVLVPLYNVAPYLSTCIDSIINQTYSNLEILLVDDGSTDESGSICDSYAAKDKRIRVIHKKNEGQAVARNLCIEKASGEYLLFVDSDDIITPDHVETLYNLVKKYKCKVSLAILQTFKEGEFIKVVPSKYEEELLSPAKAVEYMNYQVKFDTWPVCKLYHKSIFESGIRYPVGKIFEDFAITYLLLFQSDKVAYCNKVIYYYLLRSNSTEGASFSEKKMDGALEVLDSFNRHMDLIRPIMKSYQCRMVSFACHLLLKMPKNYSKRYLIKDLLYKNRRTVLLDNQARPKARLACLISYFGFSALKFVFKFVDRRK